MHIAIAGFQHETNTFAPLKAELSSFLQATAWPGLTQGPAILDVFAGMNLPIVGFADKALSQGHTLHPIVWTSAEPCAHVTDEAFDTVTGMLVEGLKSADAFDAVYLDLHGAMVTESFEDGEGEILRRVRAVIGPDMPLVISLDLHVNLTAAIVEQSDLAAIYRTYPHLDMAATGARAVGLLERVVREGKPAKCLRTSPFLTPLQAQYTGAAPNDRLFAMLEPLSGTSGVWSADIASGFPPADIRDAGPAIVAYGTSAADAQAAAGAVYDAFTAAESEFDASGLSAHEAVRKAMALVADKPVVLADMQDNAGAGATSDTTGVLQALVHGGATGAVLALLHDPEVAGSAHAYGIGERFSAELGGKLGGPGDGSFQGTFEVEALSDGVFAFTGEMYGGGVAQLGPMALLRVVDDNSEVRVVVGSVRCQCLDQAIFRHIGVDLDAAKIVVVKSTVHFRADFEPIAEAVWPVFAAGSHPCRLDQVPYQNLRTGVRLGPDGPVRGAAS